MTQIPGSSWCPAAARVSPESAPTPVEPPADRTALESAALDALANLLCGDAGVREDTARLAAWLIRANREVVELLAACWKVQPTRTAHAELAERIWRHEYIDGCSGTPRDAEGLAWALLAAGYRAPDGATTDEEAEQ